MDPRSEAQLATVMPDLAAKVRAAAAGLEAMGTYLLVVSGLRTAAEQTRCMRREGAGWAML